MKNYFMFLISLFLISSATQAGYLTTTNSDIVLRVTPVETDKGLFVEFAECSKSHMTPDCGTVIGPGAFRWEDVKLAEAALIDEADSTRNVILTVTLVGGAIGAFAGLSMGGALPHSAKFTDFAVIAGGVGTIVGGVFYGVSKLIQLMIPGSDYENEEAAAGVKTIRNSRFETEQVTIDGLNMKDFIGSLNAVLIESM